MATEGLDGPFGVWPNRGSLSVAHGPLPHEKKGYEQAAIGLIESGKPGSCFFFTLRRRLPHACIVAGWLLAKFPCLGSG